jgi:hypothetical protein
MKCWKRQSSTFAPIQTDDRPLLAALRQSRWLHGDFRYSSPMESLESGSTLVRHRRGPEASPFRRHRNTSYLVRTGSLAWRHSQRSASGSNAPGWASLCSPSVQT